MSSSTARRARGGRPARSARRARPRIAETADRHRLYQRAVQDPASDVDFLLRAWREVHGRRGRPLHFREDFCGTALLCGEWVRRHAQATAEGFDIDAEVLEWGRRNNLDPLGRPAARITLVEGDVRDAPLAPADVRCAHNFSYQVFHRRSELVDYFRCVRSGLSERGLFVMDLYGGSEAVEELVEEREIEDDEGTFTYVWEQRVFHPGTSRVDCYIHFEFEDGSRLEEAFAYHWRLYSPAELRDALHEAGFSSVRLYFEEFDEDGDGTGWFALDDAGCACEGWLAYVVAVP